MNVAVCQIDSRYLNIYFVNIIMFNRQTCCSYQMFSWWFFASEKFIITSTVIKLCDVADDVMT